MSVIRLPGGLLAQTEVKLGASTPDVYITRDRGIDGTMSPVCDLWIVKPICARDGKSASWVAAPETTRDDSYLGPYTVAAVQAWCGTVPDDDHQVIKRDGFKAQA